MNTPLYIGIILLAGLAGGRIVQYFKLPAVTGYLLAGFLLGPSVTNFITPEVNNSMALVTQFAIGLLSVSVGMELHRHVLKNNGRTLLTISIGNTMVSLTLVTLATYLMGLSFAQAIILGVVSLTVSPAGVMEIIKERKSSGPMTRTLLNLVALDNLIAITLFGLALSLVQASMQPTFVFTDVVISIIRDIGLGLLIGAFTGFVFAYFLEKQVLQDKLLVIIIAVIMVNNGIAALLDLSPVLMCIFTGIAITNLTNNRVRVASTFERINLPVNVMFLTLSGAHIELGIIYQVGLIGLAYIVARFVGRAGGAAIFARFTDLDKKVKQNIGLGLVPQAGIAIGLVTIAEQTIPAFAGTLSGVILTGAIAFEAFGPLVVEKGLSRAGEIKNQT